MTGQAISGWGRYPVVIARERRSEDLAAITRDAVLTRGLGRSYGDASLPASAGAPVAVSRLADRVLAFDPATGVLRAEAGLPLFDLNKAFLPQGWFVPVTPGTQFVTLGGMVAADVHGKNHHRAGTFGRHVRALRLRVGSGAIVDVSEDTEVDLFEATLGGVGLTGHILEVEVAMERVPSPWILAERQYVPDLETLVARLVDDGSRYPYTVAWLDAIGAGGRGRGVIDCGRWAEPDEAGSRVLSWPAGVAVPATLPDWALTRASMRLLNAAYVWTRGFGARQHVTHPQSFFYPLDVVRDWNRAYGRRGFTQYQCVIPRASAPSVHRRLFDIIARRGATPFLVVVKDLGAEGRGRLSFPMGGITFNIDLPIDRGTQALVDALNDIVAAEGGRVYLAKDAFTRAEHYRAMDPRVDRFNAIRHRWDPEGRIKSALSVRLLGDPA